MNGSMGLFELFELDIGTRKIDEKIAGIKDSFIALSGLLPKIIAERSEKTIEAFDTLIEEFRKSIGKVKSPEDLAEFVKGVTDVQKLFQSSFEEYTDKISVEGKNFLTEFQQFLGDFQKEIYNILYSGKGMIEIQKELEKFPNVLQKMSEDAEVLFSKLEVPEETFDSVELLKQRIADLEDKFSDFGSRSSSIFTQLKKGMVVFIEAIGLYKAWDIAKDTELLANNMVILGKDVKMTRKEVIGMTENIFDISSAFGESTEEVSTFIGNYLKLGIPFKKVKELSKITLQYRDVLGMTADNVVEFIGWHTRIGKLSTQSIDRLGTAMLNYAKATATTSEELAQFLVQNKTLLKYFGTGKQLEEAEKGVLKIASAFSELDVGTTAFSQMMESIVDITSQEGNKLISMFSSFGLKARDMLLEGKVDVVFEDMLKNIRSRTESWSPQMIKVMSSVFGVSEELVLALRNVSEADLGHLFDRLRRAQKEGQKMSDVWTEWRKATNLLLTRLKTLATNILGGFVLPVLSTVASALSTVVVAFSQIIKVVNLVPKPIRVFTASLLGLIVVFDMYRKAHGFFILFGLKAKLHFIELGKELLGFKGKFLTVFTKILPKAGIVERLLPKASIFSRILPKAGAFGGVIKTVFSGAFKGLFPMLRTVFMTGLKLVPILGWIVTGISLLPLLHKFILKPLLKLFGGDELWKQWQGFLGKIWGGLKDAFGVVWKEIKGAFGDVWEALFGGLKDIWESFKDIYKELKLALKPFFEIFGIGIKGAEKSSLDFIAVIKIIAKVIGWGIRIAFLPLIGVIKVLSWIIKGWSLLVKGAISLVEMFGKGLKKLVEKLTGIKQEGTGVATIFKVMKIGIIGLIGPLGWIIMLLIKFKKQLWGVIKFSPLFIAIREIKSLIKFTGEAFKNLFKNISSIFKLLESKKREFGVGVYKSFVSLFSNIMRLDVKFIESLFDYRKMTSIIQRFIKFIGGMIMDTIKLFPGIELLMKWLEKGQRAQTMEVKKTEVVKNVAEQTKAFGVSPNIKLLQEQNIILKKINTTMNEGNKQLIGTLKEQHKEVMENQELPSPERGLIDRFSNFASEFY